VISTKQGEGDCNDVVVVIVVVVAKGEKGCVA